MNKQEIKVIKRTEGGAKTPPVAKKAAKKVRRKKEQSVADTIQSWITERRENNDAEHRSSIAAWNTDIIPAKAV
jgi:hypothetical protein